MPAATLTETLHSLHHSSDEGASSSSSMDNNNKSQMFNNYYGSSSTSVSEIEEENSSSHLHLDDIGPMATISEENNEGVTEDSVYVAVGKSETSMEALTWTLKNLATPSTIVYLVHVFPEIKHIPNPSVVSAMTVGIGMVPKSQVSPEQVESYMAQERGKRRELLHKFLQTCSACKVKVDTILIESDLVAKAILDLIPVLQITKLVLGANKSQLRKLRTRKGNGIADQVLQNAPESCKFYKTIERNQVDVNLDPTQQWNGKLATTSIGMGHECLHHYSNDEETSSTWCTCCCCIGFRRNQVFHYSQSCLRSISRCLCIIQTTEDLESSVFSFDIHNEKDNVHVVTPSSTVYLIRVFPEIRLIPRSMLVMFLYFVYILSSVFFFSSIPMC